MLAGKWKAVCVLAVALSLLVVATIHLGPLQAVTVLFHPVTCVGAPPTLRNAAGWACSSSTPAGATCNATCKPGFPSSIGHPPFAVCGSDGMWAKPVGLCGGCEGLPSLNLLRGTGVWPSSCDGQGSCTAVCNEGRHGAPHIKCGTKGWRDRSLVGGCRKGPVCVGPPTLKLPNTVFVSDCADTLAGGNCTAICFRGYGGGPLPTLACVKDPSSASGASWANSTVGSCNKFCAGMPPADLLKGLGSWPESCKDGTAINTECNAVCHDHVYGSASITCGAYGWVRNTYRGGCSKTPVCNGTPKVKVTLGYGRFTAKCGSTPVNSSCEAECLNGYGPAGNKPPTIACLHDPLSPDKASWAATAEGTCIPLCTSAPPAKLLLDGEWPTSCTNSLPGTVCNATCNHTGSASITCVMGDPALATQDAVAALAELDTGVARTDVVFLTAAWAVGTFEGQCRKPAVGQQQEGSKDPQALVSTLCDTAPPTIFNGHFIPEACAGAELGDECLAICDDGFGAAGNPTVTCELPSWSDRPLWSTPNPRLCMKSTVSNGTAFIVADDDNAVYICSLVNGQFHACNASDAAVGDTADQPLNAPLGIVVQGQHVWISDREADTQGSRVRVCTWSDRHIISCRSQSVAMRGAGQLAIDVSRDTIFQVVNARSCVMACKGIYALQEECVCTEFPLLQNGFPFGVAVGFGRLWVAASSGVLHCPLDDSLSGFDWTQCKAADLVDAKGTPFIPLRVLVDDTNGTQGTLLMSDGVGTVAACSHDLTDCFVVGSSNRTISSNSTTTRMASSNQQQPWQLPWLSGFAVGGRHLYLLLPQSDSLQPVVNPALAVCSQRVASASVTGCSLKVSTATRTLSLSGSVSVVVVPQLPTPTAPSKANHRHLPSPLSLTNLVHQSDGSSSAITASRGKHLHHRRLAGLV